MSCKNGFYRTLTISLIVGMLFACLVNMQIVDNTIGKTNSLSLSDKIHIFTMINLFVSICMTIISRKYSGFKNGQWEFNYNITTNTMNTYINVLAFLNHNYTVLGGAHHIDLTNWNASDDTIMIIATCEAVVKGGGETNYKDHYLKWLDLLIDSKTAFSTTGKVFTGLVV